MHSDVPIPIITIDGPSASGKGTVARQVAQQLGFHYLDSGALYRIVAYAAHKTGIDWQNAIALAEMIPSMQIQFMADDIWLTLQHQPAQEVSHHIREESISQGASIVAAHPQVRQSLTTLQHAFCQPPGLVADGRDMGTVIFPAANTKIYLTASAEVRAQRRVNQLQQSGKTADYAAILLDLQQRDTRDSQRATAPLKPAPEAHILDTDNITVAQALAFVMDKFHAN